MSEEKRIGHYKFGRTLGQGSFGKVKLAQHEVTGHQVAVKILNRKKIQTSAMDKKIRREIKILKLLRHSHIIRLYEVIETPADIFMVMEYVDGGELFEYIVKQGRLTEEAARRFFQQIICGVEYIHHFKVVHRDLKPENVLLDKDLNVKIADFGLSNLMTDGDFLKTSCGSPNYAAPEVISGKLYAGPEVDVWSCGVILYALLAGKLPFDEESIPALFKKIKEGQFSMPSTFPGPCRDLIQKMLEVDPLQRITIEQIREHEWFKEKLAAYLQVKPVDMMQSDEGVDHQVLDYLVGKLDIEKEIGLKALLSGVKNDISVAYQILLDKKHRTEASKQGIEIQSRPHSNSSLGKSVPITGTSMPTGTNNGIGVTTLTAAPLMDSLLVPKKKGDKKAEQAARSGYNHPTQPVTVSSPVTAPVFGTPMGTDEPKFGSLGPLSQGENVLGTSPALAGGFGDGSPQSMGRIAPQAPRPKEEVVGGLSAALSEPMKIQPREVEAGGAPPVEGGLSLGLKAEGGIASDLAAMDRSAESSPGPSPVVGNSEVYNNWRLGLFTQLSSKNAMERIYSCLKEMGMVWKVLGQFHLVAKILPTAAGKEGDQVVRREMIGIQLLRMHDRHDRGYLIDCYGVGDASPLKCMDLINDFYTRTLPHLC